MSQTSAIYIYRTKNNVFFNYEQIIFLIHLTNKKKLFKIFFEILPLVLIFFGSIALTYSLKIIKTDGIVDLGDGLYAVGGGPKIMGMPLNLPQQNDRLFYIGMIIFFVGSLWEIVRIIKQKFSNIT